MRRQASTAPVGPMKVFPAAAGNNRKRIYSIKEVLHRSLLLSRVFWDPGMASRVGIGLLVLLTVAAFSCVEAGKGIPALWVFGDSTVDTGNQNYITSVIKSNYPPYGRDFVPPGPTGRFCNGKVPNDFLADYLEIPRPVNFLSQEAKGGRILTGVNFASSGSGFLDITGLLFGVMNLTRQLDNFGKIKKDMIAQIGEAETERILTTSIYLVSTGSNDFVNSYNINPILQHAFTPKQYEDLLLSTIETNLKTLHGYGARTLYFNSLSPIGCVPEQLNFFNSKDGACLEKVNGPLKSFNKGLQDLLARLRQEIPDYNLHYVNVYDTLFGAITTPEKYGFKYGNTACCGEGAYNGLPCLPAVSKQCDNADEYVFWDLFHPSQKTYEMLTNDIIKQSGL
ncbi:hypothetical protein R1flu_007274 [Riccia fluitans]|uniref:GDSL esterase/lipase n=1 Tax=Riccia fluitans TaxID=41844 RepID=A0ABD1YYE3_9MARC